MTLWPIDCDGYVVAAYIEAPSTQQPAPITQKPGWPALAEPVFADTIPMGLPERPGALGGRR